MNKQLLQKYLDGNCTSSEAKEVENFLSKKEELDLLSEIADENWVSDYSGISNENIDSDLLFKKINQHLPQQKRRFPSLLKYAAVLLIGFATVFTLKYLQTTETVTKQITKLELVQKQTSKGQKSTIFLSDGSKVILNSMSSLEFVKYFSDTSRVIKLTGEAFFQVAKDAQRPFTVITGNTRTTALGTSFNINSRSRTNKISLATGEVKIKTGINTSPYFLLPGEALEVDKGKGTSIKSKFDLNIDLSWKDGILYFDNTPLPQIIKTLELWYDVKIHFNNTNINSKKYTGKFQNVSLEHVLKSMSFALDFNYTLNKKNAKINFKQTR